jgi:hypothetical protein
MTLKAKTGQVLAVVTAVCSSGCLSTTSIPRTPPTTDSVVSLPPKTYPVHPGSEEPPVPVVGGSGIDWPRNEEPTEIDCVEAEELCDAGAYACDDIADYCDIGPDGLDELPDEYDWDGG